MKTYTLLALAAAFLNCDALQQEDASSDVPVFFEKYQTARWMVHNLTWGVLSTTSSRDEVKGAAFGNPYSFADANNGVPYFYASVLDASMTDVFVAGNDQVSLALSEASYSSSHPFKACDIDAGGDPENPPCARLVISGTLLNVTGTDEGDEAMQALFASHPSMADWPADHSWFVSKIDISDLWLIDIYGGAKDLDVDKYLAVEPSELRAPREYKL